MKNNEERCRTCQGLGLIINQGQAKFCKCQKLQKSIREYIREFLNSKDFEEINLLNKMWMAEENKDLQITFPTYQNDEESVLTCKLKQSMWYQESLLYLLNKFCLLQQGELLLIPDKELFNHLENVHIIASAFSNKSYNLFSKISGGEADA